MLHGQHGQHGQTVGRTPRPLGGALHTMDMFEDELELGGHGRVPSPTFDSDSDDDRDDDDSEEEDGEEYYRA